MKFTGQAIAMAALVAMGATSAHALTTTAGVGTTIGASTLTLQTSSSGALSFSNGSGFDGTDPNTLGGLIGALNVGNVKIAAVAPATAFEGTIEDEFGDAIRATAGAAAPVTSVTIDAAGNVSSVGSAGGALQTGSRISGTLTGGSASVTNLQFDLANRVVIADLAGTSLASGTKPAVNFNLPGTTLWNIGNVTGPTTVPLAALQTGNDIVGSFTSAGYTYNGIVNGEHSFTANNVISGLTVTTAGFNFFRDSLGLLSTGQNALAAVNNDAQGWGTVNSTLNITVAVPEPSTYALGALGLAMIAVAARRKKSA